MWLASQPACARNKLVHGLVWEKLKGGQQAGFTRPSLHTRADSADSAHGQKIVEIF